MGGDDKAGPLYFSLQTIFGSFTTKTFTPITYIIKSNKKS